ncbi:MAG TPA: LLM class F420-dependent oxidoreductase, partial [Dehalococcoidia bacterium]|nr:LLM class F420-dependent oxidoreductase [Dehalococcoidia bacterium]
LPTRGPAANPTDLAALVQRGEALGFHSVVVADHIVLPVSYASKYPYTVSGAFPSAGDAMEQLTLMSWVAAKTRRLRIISSVMIVPHRNPVVTAKALATLDVLSEGRLTVGVGVGWLREEFEALAAPDFDRRGAVTDEYLAIFKVLWTRSPASFSGRFYRFKELWCLPRPVQEPHPPIWVGGHSPAALRRAARLGDGWHPVGANPAAPLLPEDMRDSIAELHRLAEAAGRDPTRITISYKAPLYDTSITGDRLRADGDQRRPFSGTQDQILADIDAYEALGVSELIVDFRGDRLTDSLERMQRFADLVQLEPAAA